MTGASEQRAGKDYLMTLKDNRGYTLAEMIIAMGIFVIVMVAAGEAFKTVLHQGGQQSRLAETQIGNIVGLELLRSDLQNAGYGLPWAFRSAPLASAYTEITADDSNMPISATFWEAGKSPRTFNDATGGVPRAVQSGNTTFNLSDGVGSKYLVIKSLAAAPGVTQKKWITVTYSDTDKHQSDWGAGQRAFAANSVERVIVMRGAFNEGVPTRELQVIDGVFAVPFKEYTTLTLPHSSGDVFQVYGVEPSVDPRMPFNRADYYVSRPANISPACAPGTGVLYKAVANQTTGYKEMPLLDCVADMQVVYGLGPVGSPNVNLHQTTVPLPANPADAAKAIREQVKEIRLYILAHEGRKDRTFSYPSQQVEVGEDFGGGLQGRMFNLETLIGTGWRNYRWKVYTIVARPKNT